MSAETEETGDRARFEMYVWIGFALSFAVAFFIVALAAEDLGWSGIGALFAVAMAVGFVVHGVLGDMKIMLASGLLSILVTATSLLLQPLLFPLGYIVLGGGLTLSALHGETGHGYESPSSEGPVGIIVMVGGSILVISQYVSIDPSPDIAIWMIWMVLVGLIFVVVSMRTRNIAVRYLGIFWVVVAVVCYTFFGGLMMPALGILFAAGMAANFVNLYRVLGRTPRIGELFSFATRALFLRALKRPIDEYGVIAILISGNVGADKVINEVVSRLEKRCVPILLLGPTVPRRLSIPDDARVGWVTDLSGIEGLEHTMLSPEDPTSVRVFLSKAIESLPEDRRPVILGDFLDNLIPLMDEGAFYRYYSDSASGAKVTGHTTVFIVKADIHPEVAINIVKRFADVIIENREREQKGKLRREVRVSNLVDDFNTDWESY